jgi:hypothetical protein
MPEGDKVHLVIVSLVAGLMTFIFLSTGGFKHQLFEPVTSMGAYIIGIAAVFFYPIIGALLYPFTRGLKAMALGRSSLSNNPGDKIGCIAYWPLVTLYALVVYPCLILVNFLVD